MSRALASSAIFSSICSTDVWYGISVTTICVAPVGPSSISALARILIEPRPVRNARHEPGAAHDLGAGREVRALDELHEVVDGGVGVVDAGASWRR